MKELIAMLEQGMSRARNNADGQTKQGHVILPTKEYDALYYAAYKVK